MTTRQRRADAAHPNDPTTELIDRTPPHSPEAERGVLGSMLLSPRVTDDVAMALRAHDFYSPAYRRVYETMIELHNGGKQIDLPLVIDRMKKFGDFEEIGGASLLFEIVDSVPTAANAVWYAEIIREKATTRDLIHASTETLRDAYGGAIESRELLAQAESRVFAVADRRGEDQATGITEILAGALSTLKNRKPGGEGFVGVPTGFADLDSRLGGLRPGNLIILAGRPSMGKSALVVNIVDNATTGYGKRALIVSLEMNRDEIAERMLSATARVGLKKLRDGNLDASDIAKLIEAHDTIAANAKLTIDDTPGRTVTEIAAQCRRAKRKGGLDLLVIDYLQLIEPDNPKDQRQEQVSKIARRLKGLAREMNIPVLCLSQLNRQTESAKDNRPRLSHLRESGAIEQDADVVMFIHRDEYYATAPDERERLKGKAVIITEKMRQGETGEDPLSWVPEYCQFRNAVREQFSAPASKTYASAVPKPRVGTTNRGQEMDFDDPNYLT